MFAKRNLPKLLSIIVPVYCEEESLSLFLETLLRVVRDLPLSAEIIMVDDGSTDRTLPLLKSWVEKEKCIRVISLARNYGQQMALLVGLDQSRGDLTIMMDGDLQHPPETIPKLLEKWREGYDMVNTRRLQTQGIGFLKKMFSSIFYRLFNSISFVKIHPDSSDFRLLDAKVVKAVCQYRQKNFFLRGIVSEIGFPSTMIDFVAPQRKHGKPSYTFSRSLDLALRGIFSHSNVGLKIPFFMGVVLIFMVLLNLIYNLYLYFHGVALVKGWLSLFAVLALFFSLSFIFFGVQGFYLYRIYQEIRQQPLYNIKETL